MNKTAFYIEKAISARNMAREWRAMAKCWPTGADKYLRYARDNYDQAIWLIGLARYEIARQQERGHAIAA